MKKLLASLCLAGLVALAGCKKSDPSGPGAPPITGKGTAPGISSNPNTLTLKAPIGAKKVKARGTDA